MSLDLTSMYGEPPVSTAALIDHLVVAMGMLHDLHAGYPWKELSENYEAFAIDVKRLLDRAALDYAGLPTPE